MNLSTCPNCRVNLIAEEFPSHKCFTKRVDLTYQWWVSQDIEDVGEVLFVKAKDGTFYIISPTKMGQPNRTPTRGDSVRNSTLSHYLGVLFGCPKRVVGRKESKR